MFTNSPNTLRLSKNRAPPPAAETQAQLPTIQPPEAPTMSTQDANEASKPARQIHTVKLDKEWFDMYRTKKLSAQTRTNDRHYLDGDILIQREWDGFLNVHTGRELISCITHITNPPGLMPGYVLIHSRALA